MSDLLRIILYFNSIYFAGGVHEGDEIVKAGGEPLFDIDLDSALKVIMQAARDNQVGTKKLFMFICVYE